MEGDIFTRSTNSNNLRQGDDNNFFMQPEQISVTKNQTEPSRHLNDYDFNILKEDAYKDIEDEIFKLEYKINRLEKHIEDLDGQIQSALDIHSYALADNLRVRKSQLELDLNNLKEIYNEASISAKISGGISNKVKDRLSIIKRQVMDFGMNLISKIPGKMSSFVELRNSLAKLENINKSVDELVSMNIPYGESIDKYEQLSKYIVKANTIQSDISKVWKKL